MAYSHLAQEYYRAIRNIIEMSYYVDVRTDEEHVDENEFIAECLQRYSEKGWETMNFRLLTLFPCK